MNAAFRNVRPAAAPGSVSVERPRDLVRLLSLDAVTIDQTRLVCRWYRDLDGRLACYWEAEAMHGHRPKPAMAKGVEGVTPPSSCAVIPDRR